MLETINKYLTNFWNIIDIEFIFKFIIVYIAIIWIVMILWVIRDISIRTNNIFYQIVCVILISITAPIGGILFYLLIRPSRTLNENFYSEIEENIDILEELINERKNIENYKKKDIEKISKEKEKNNKKTHIKKQKSNIKLKNF